MGTLHETLSPATSAGETFSCNICRRLYSASSAGVIFFINNCRRILENLHKNDFLIFVFHFLDCFKPDPGRFGSQVLLSRRREADGEEFGQR